MSCPDMAPASVRGSQRWLAACGARCAASALALLVPRVGADDHDAAVPADDPALTADLLDARLDLHGAVSTGLIRYCSYSVLVLFGTDL